MTAADVGLWTGIIGALTGVLGAVFVAIDSWRRRRKLSVDQAGVVASTAIQLVERLEQRCGALEQQLDDANRDAEGLTGKLRAANDRADALKRGHDDMASKLADAQAEVRVLRGQVKMLSAELDRRENPSEDRRE